MLVPAERRKVGLISREIISKNSNAYDHNLPTSQADGQTDGQLIMAITLSATLRTIIIDNLPYPTHIPAKI